MLCLKNDMLRFAIVSELIGGELEDRAALRRLLLVSDCIEDSAVSSNDAHDSTTRQAEKKLAPAQSGVSGEGMSHDNTVAANEARLSANCSNSPQSYREHLYR